MIRKLFHAIVVVLGIITIIGFFTACDKIPNPTAPTEVTPPPTITLPLPSSQCWEQGATNYGGSLPCLFSPGGEKRIGWVGFPEGTGSVGTGVAVPAFGYSGKIEARIRLDKPGTYKIRLVLINPETNRLIKISEVVEISDSGSISLPHDGTACTALVRDAGTVPAPGSATFWYLPN